MLKMPHRTTRPYERGIILVEIKANTNFYSLKGTVHDNSNAEYQEYRKCWIEYPEKFILRDFPLHLDVEATNLCNLRCTFCDKQPLLNSGQFGSMDFELYKKIIDEGSLNRLWGLKLSYRGEPLLHQKIVEMVKYAKDKGVLDVYFNTNGMLLNKKMSSGLIDAGLDRISVSIEGVDPVAFENIRLGAKFDVIKSNILNLIEIRERKGLKYPKVRIQTVLFPDMDIDEYKNYWSPYCDEVAAVDYKDESEREEGIICQWACPQLWQRMTIGWDGTIFMCNNDDLNLLPLGNVKDKTIAECWQGAKLNEVRGLHRAGESHRVVSCNGCPWRTAQIKKIYK